MGQLASHHREMLAAGLRDTAAHYTGRWCEYIWYKNLTFNWFRRTDVGDVSDTELQFASFTL